VEEILGVRVVVVEIVEFLELLIQIHYLHLEMVEEEQMKVDQLAPEQLDVSIII
jgi:hypothetical protein